MHQQLHHKRSHARHQIYWIQVFGIKSKQKSLSGSEEKFHETLPFCDLGLLASLPVDLGLCLSALLKALCTVVFKNLYLYYD